jgi:SAM-dependent methyltransferase
MNDGEWSDAELYELENADDPHFDLPFWRGLVQELRPRRMLELACGTGRLSVPLAAAGTAAREGFELVGIDSSEPFLARARAVLADQPEDVRAAVRLERGDMRDFVLDGPFDLIAIPFNSLAYLQTAADRLAALRTARRHLAPGGRLVFDVLAPRLDYLAEALHPFPPVRLDVDFELPEAGVARFLRTCVDRYDAATQTLTSTFLYEIHRTGGATERHVRDVHWHIYYPAELELLLTTAGLEPVVRHGDWDGAPFDASSSRYVFVCVAT